MWHGLLSVKTVHRMMVVLAIISTLAGAVVSVLPAFVIGLVNLFYNSAGGVLILLGSLISLLPHPAAIVPSGSSRLPVFQTLSVSVLLVLLRSLIAATFCCAGFALLVSSRSCGERTRWLAVVGCCLAAAIGGGHTALAVAPAIAASLFIRCGRRHRLS